MSDQFRKRWDIEQRRQRTLKPDYLEEIQLDNQKKNRALVFTRFGHDLEFRVKEPEKFAVARRNRDGVISCIRDPIIFLRECHGDRVYVFFSSSSMSDFAESYGLDERLKSTKELFRRLRAYATAIKELLQKEFREWPMKAFVRPPLPREFKFSNRQGMAASVWVFPMEL